MAGKAVMLLNVRHEYSSGEWERGGRIDRSVN
jgi:hypothetical protein